MLKVAAVLWMFPLALFLLVSLRRTVGLHWVLGFVVTLVLGITWLGEPFSWTRLAGCGLIVAGVWLLALDA